MRSTTQVEQSFSVLQRQVTMLLAFVTSLLIFPVAAYGDVTDFAFGAPEVLQLPKETAPSCLALSDLDGDGDLDGVLVGRNIDGRVVLLEGGPNGQLTVSGELTAGGQTDWVELADIDNDGDDDIVLAMRDQAGSITIFNGTPDGAFEEKPRTISVGREIRSVQVVDLDANGTFDIVALGHRTEDVSVFLGDGAGEFELSHQMRLAPWKNGYVYPQSCSVHDIDGDSVLDIAPVSIGARSLSLIRGVGNGSFKPTRSWEAPIVNNEAGGCAYSAVADFDGDGLLEFVLPQTTWGQQWCVLFELDSEGDVSETRAISASQTGLSWIPTAADFDSDGDIDLAIGHALPGVVVFMENVGEPDGPVTFLEPQAFVAGVFIRYLNAVDLDGDGDQDLLALDFAGDAVFIFRNGLNEGFVSGTASEKPLDLRIPAHVRSLDGSGLARWLAEVDAAELRSISRGHKSGATKVEEKQ